MVFTAAGLFFGLAAAVLAAEGRWLLALVLFAANRLLDGLDGEVARLRAEMSDEGGYADMLTDSLVYVAIPIGAAAGSAIDHIWPIASVLVASFYLNATSWMYLAALLEKRGRSRSTTSVVMPAGLVEGAETIVFFSVMLALPGLLDWTMGAMAGAVTAGAGIRFVHGHRALRSERAIADRVDA